MEPIHEPDATREAAQEPRALPVAGVPLSAEEAELVKLYRENRCGDPACEGARFSAAQSVLKGATTHREVADMVSQGMHDASVGLTRAHADAAQGGVHRTGDGSLAYNHVPIVEALPPVTEADLDAALDPHADFEQVKRAVIALFRRQAQALRLIKMGEVCTK